MRIHCECSRCLPPMTWRRALLEVVAYVAVMAEVCWVTWACGL